MWKGCDELAETIVKILNKKEKMSYYFTFGCEMIAYFCDCNTNYAKNRANYAVSLKIERF